jgi:hypothetical protein
VSVLWFGLLAGPLAWSAALLANYALSSVACAEWVTWLLHGVTVVALAVAGAAGWAARAAWRQMKVPQEREPTEATHARARLMAIGGVAMSIWFAVVIAATGIPVLILEPCMP